MGPPARGVHIARSRRPVPPYDRPRTAVPSGRLVHRVHRRRVGAAAAQSIRPPPKPKYPKPTPRPEQDPYERGAGSMRSSQSATGGERTGRRERREVGSGSPLAAGDTHHGGGAAERCPGYRPARLGSAGAARRALAIRHLLLPGSAAPAPACRHMARGADPGPRLQAASSRRRRPGFSEGPPRAQGASGLQRGSGDGGEKRQGGGDAMAEREKEFTESENGLGWNGP